MWLFSKEIHLIKEYCASVIANILQIPAITHCNRWKNSVK